MATSDTVVVRTAPNRSGDLGADDADDEHGDAVDEEQRAGGVDAEVLEVQGEEGAEGGESHEAEQQDRARHDRRGMEPPLPAGLAGRGLLGGGEGLRVGPAEVGGHADGEHGTDRGEGRGHGPDEAGTAGVVEQFADERSDGEPAVDGDGEERGGLAPAVVGAQVLGRGGDPDEEGRLTEAGDEPEEHEDGEGGDQAVPGDRHGGDQPADDGERTTADPVAEPTDHRPDQGGGHGERADGDADRGAAAPEGVLDVAGQHRQVHAHRREVAEPGGDDQPERGGDQLRVAVVGGGGGDVGGHEGFQHADRRFPSRRRVRIV